MKILLIAHGLLPVPPKGWGAIEACLWSQKQYLEPLGHVVDIANTTAIHEVISHANERNYDFVHTHNERFVLECVAHLERPFAVTSQHGGLHAYDPDGPEPYRGLRYLFKNTMQAPANIVLSEAIREKYVRSGYRGLLRVLGNGVETEQFKYHPVGNGRAACIGRVQSRKRQVWLAAATRDRVPVDYIGPGGEEPLRHLAGNPITRYLGEWDRETLHERLTEYSCMTLFSESEAAAPKVVLEALAAGLSLVVSEACTANLTPAPFITVIPDGERDPDVVTAAIQAAIDANPKYRADIRRYALEHFDYRSVIIPKYLEIIEEVREAWRTHWAAA